MEVNMKKTLISKILIALCLTVSILLMVCSCFGHTHSFVEGKCECGESDPNYVPPHTHTFVEGKCECGESDPNYVPPEGTTAEYPILVLFDENKSAKVTVPAGATYYFAAYGLSNETTLTANGEVVEVTYGAMRMPSTFTITNSTDVAVEYTLVLTYPIGSMNNPEAITELGDATATLAAGSQGYYYTWTATADGMLVVNMSYDNAGWQISLNNQTSYAMTDLLDSTVGVYNTAIAVKTGDVVIINVNTFDSENPWNAPAGEVAFTTSFVAATEAEPYEVQFTWNEEYTEATASVSVNAGATFYFQTYGSGMVLTINGVEYGILTSANPRMPAAFSITNNEEYAKSYTLVLTYPVGSMNNPEAITELGDATATLAAGSQGYYYTWTAPATGYFSFKIYSENWFYVINNMTTYAYGDNQWSDSDPVVNPTVIFVNEGDVIQIIVNTYDPEDEWNAPAGTLEFNTAFGGDSAENPFLLDFIWNDAQSEASATVTVPAGATLYFGQYRIGGMYLSINGGEPTLLENAGPFSPVAFSITNSGTEAAEYTFTISYPIGSQMNPEIIEDLSWYDGQVSQAAGNSQGYFYNWTAQADGSITLYFAYEGYPEGYVCDIMITNLNTYEQKTLLADGVDKYGLEVTMAVKEGDVICIAISAVEDADGNFYPAADMTWCGNFSYPVGSQQNPIQVEWIWDDEYANATATVTVSAGNSLYFQGIDSMILTVNGEVVELDAEGTFLLSNEDTEDVEYALALATPVGAYSNPEVIENVADFSISGSLKEEELYYYIWTATEDTTVVLDITAGANITVDKLTYVEGSEWPISEQVSLAEPDIDDNYNYIGWIIEENLTIEVVAGQQLKIEISALTDWETWSAPAIDYTLTIVEAAE